MAGVAGRSGKPKDKPFIEALRMEIADAGGDLKRLRKIAAKALELAEAGEAWAVQFVADRLDGKPAQSVEVSGEVKQTVMRAPVVASSAADWAEQHVPEVHRSH